MEKFETVLTHILTTLEELKRDVHDLRIENYKLTEQLENNLEFYNSQSRLNNLVFYGLSESDEEDSVSITHNLLDIFNEKLNICIASSNIVKAYRIGKKQENKTRPVLIKFNKSKHKEDVLRSAKKLKGTNYSLNEHFTTKVMQEKKNKKNKDMPSNEEVITPTNIARVTNETNVTNTRINITDKNISEELLHVYNDVTRYISQGRDKTAGAICWSVETNLTNAEYHPYVATMLSNLAHHYRTLDDYDRVTELLNHSFAYQLATLTSNKHHVILDTINTLIEVNTENENYSAAITLYELIFKMDRTNLGRSRVQMLNTLGEQQLLKNNLEDAEVYFNKAFRIIDDSTRNQEYYDNETILTKGNRIHLFMKQGELEKANTIFQDILNKEHERHFGKNKGNLVIWELAYNTCKDNSTFTIDQIDWSKVPNTVSKEVYTLLEYLTEWYTLRKHSNAADVITAYTI